MKTRHTIGMLLLFVFISLVGKQAMAQEPADRQKEDQARKEMELQEKKMEDMRERERSRVYIRTTGDEVNPFIFSSGNQSQLTLRNSFNGGSDTSKGEFEVASGTRNFRCMINGKVRSGSILVRVLYPNGKVFRELTINSSAEIFYNQSLNIKEEEEDQYTGSWKYEVIADRAEGNYMLTISTN
jgi:hypothetical protein